MSKKFIKSSSKTPEEFASELDLKYPHSTFNLEKGIEQITDAPYKYTVDPIKRKVLSLLKNESVSEEETPEFSDIYKQTMNNVGKKNIGNFLKTFAAGASEDPSGISQEAIQAVDNEKFADKNADIAGFATELAVDPVALATAGANKLKKIKPVFSKIKKVVN